MNSAFLTFATAYFFLFGANIAVGSGGPEKQSGKPPATTVAMPKVENIDQLMKEFVHNPHPMGSKAQEKYSKAVEARLKKHGLKVEVQNFTVKAPNRDAPRFDGLVKGAQDTVELTGRNILATRKGTQNCSLLIGGHYDTKPFDKFKFVGANDGGSSTVVMQELARVIGVKRNEAEFAKKMKGSWLECDLVLAFFDGEEAQLQDWDRAQREINIKDNLYGSSAFKNTLAQEKPQYSYLGKTVSLVIIIDMVGHKNQNIFITKGSDEKYSAELLKNKGGVEMSKVPLGVEDDHIPFAQAGIPYVHLIDWTNLNEWHTEKDTPAIISNVKLKSFAEVLLRFLESER